MIKNKAKNHYRFLYSLRSSEDSDEAILSKPTSSRESNDLHSSEDSDETVSSNPTSSKESNSLISSEDSDETVLNKPITSKGSYTRDALLCGSRNVKPTPIIISDENIDEDDQTNPSKRLISMGSRFKQFVQRKNENLKAKHHL